LSRNKFFTNPDQSQLARHVDDLRAALQNQDPTRLAHLTGSHYEPAEDGLGYFTLAVLGQELRVSYPGYVAADAHSGENAPVPTQALLAYYYTIADGSPLVGKWISFSELPDGRFYTSAFQSYTGRELLRAFQDDIQDLANAAAHLPQINTAFWGDPIGDHCFSFQALPRVPLQLIYWQGDEDFPSSYQVLFDGSVSHYLNTDVCAILGSMLTRKLISKRA
jgi:hypothetical protein